ncbi:hypothetical protein XYCOK13_05290 [Xylanibacillus composti]|uniref:DUF4129 domain-containing protein n=1 Tax=Xylanibacillus composti TaxID=1572762 RepID=A0A8J4H176_9BACL|nr:hypothetical protein XYCOK13_05290 [Xylanibacillus composti]
MKENGFSPWKRSVGTGAIESIGILPFLPFIYGSSFWLGLPVFAVACGIFYAIGAWAAPRMMRFIRWAALIPVLFGVFMLTDSYAAILAGAYMFSRGGKHQGEWRFVYWLGSFLFHLVALLWIVRTPELASYVPLLWGSAFVSVALFLFGFQRQLVRDAAVYHKLITSETLRVGLVTVSVMLGAALLVTMLSWTYVGERMIGPLTHFADSFKETLTDNLGPITEGVLPYPVPENPPEEQLQLYEGNKFIEFVLNVIGGFLVPAAIIGSVGWLLYLNRHEIRAFLFSSSEEKEQESLPYTEERRSLREDGEARHAHKHAAISYEEWKQMNNAQKVRSLYLLLVRRWIERGHIIRPYETPREIGKRMDEPDTDKLMDAYSRVKYGGSTQGGLPEEELDSWYNRLNEPERR